MRGRKVAGRAERALRSIGIVGSAVVVAIACGGAASPAGTGAPAPPSVAGPSAAPAAPGQTTAADTPAGSLIVRTGRLELEVKDLSGSLPKARDLVAGLGGYVSGSEESNTDEQQQATITYRVPVERWQDAINGLRGLADKVISETTSSDEVTAQVVDLDARLLNLRATEASLRDIMAKAANTAEVLAVQDKLTVVREQIERLTAARNDLTGRAALATLAAHWATPVVAAVTEVRSGWDLGREIDRALAQTVAAAQTAASILVWFALTGIPVFGPILLLTWLGILLYRRWSAGRPPSPPRPGGWTPLPAGVAAGPSWGASPSGPSWGAPGADRGWGSPAGAGSSDTSSTSTEPAPAAAPEMEDEVTSDPVAAMDADLDELAATSDPTDEPRSAGSPTERE